MAVTINKAVVPEDYTELVVNSTQPIVFDGTTTTSGLLTSTPTGVVIAPTGFSASVIETKPAYNIVAEYSYAFKTASKNYAPSISIDGSTITNSITFPCTINVGNDVCAYYRYIRFIIKPNLTIKNTSITTSATLTVYITFSVMSNGISYTYSKRLIIPPNMSNTLSAYAFVFDTKTKTITDYTSKGTHLWSSI